jgi:hypothetical protein
VLGGIKGKLANFNWNLTGSYGDSDAEGRAIQRQFPAVPHWFAALDAVRDPASGNRSCAASSGHQSRLFPGQLRAVEPVRQRLAVEGLLRLFRGGFEVSRVKSRGRATSRRTSRALCSICPPARSTWRWVANIVTNIWTMTSNNGPVDPDFDLTGLRTYAGVYNLTYQQHEPGQGPNGTQDVKEGYGEVAVPILRDTPFFQASRSERRGSLHGLQRFAAASGRGRAASSWSPIQTRSASAVLISQRHPRTNAERAVRRRLVHARHLHRRPHQREHQH